MSVLQSKHRTEPSIFCSLHSPKKQNIFHFCKVFKAARGEVLAAPLEQRGSAPHMENESRDQIFPEVTQWALGSGRWLLTSAVSGVTGHLTACQAPETA